MAVVSFHRSVVTHYGVFSSSIRHLFIRPALYNVYMEMMMMMVMIMMMMVMIMMMMVMIMIMMMMMVMIMTSPKKILEREV
jgi:hypothetical protein